MHHIILCTFHSTSNATVTLLIKIVSHKIILVLYVPIDVVTLNVAIGLVMVYYWCTESGRILKLHVTY
jgi:hypothetical protein